MLIGNTFVIESLKKLASSGNLSHAYLFYGPAMVGKRTLAQAFAKFLEKGEFEILAEGEVLQDAKIFDAALAKRLDPARKDSVGIETILELKKFLWQRPAASARRTAILDQAEMMTQEAQNALLRIAEEPPPSTLLILIASDSESILPTLLSRLHKVYFSKVGETEIAEWLEKEFKIKKSDATNLAKGSLGKPGLAAALLRNERLKGYIKAAEQLLKTPEGKRRDFIKELIEPEDFRFNEFLDALILCVAMDRHSEYGEGISLRLPRSTSQSLASLAMTPRSPTAWHKLLKLRSRTANFPLNPRLQLENALNEQPPLCKQ